MISDSISFTFITLQSSCTVITACILADQISNFSKIKLNFKPTSL